LHDGSGAVISKASHVTAQSFFHHHHHSSRVRLRTPFHHTGNAGKGDVMSIFSTKSSFVIAAAIVGAISVTSFAASAGPFLGPPAKPGCIGCNPNTWTPGNHHNNHWNGGGYGFGGGFGLNINVAEPVSDAGDCYYVRRQVFIPQVGVVSKRALVCN
jgi:hypothetical protein